MSEHDSQSRDSHPLARLIELLSPEPVLLYGIGSIIVLTALLGVGLAGDQPYLVIGAAVLLLLAALAAGTHVIVRRTAAEDHARSAGPIREGIDVRGKRDIKAQGGTIARDSGGEGGIRIDAGRDITASEGGIVAERGGSKERPLRSTRRRS